MKELNAFRKFLAEGHSKLMSQGKYWVKNNDLGPKTTTADIKKWVDGNFEKYGKPGDDKAKIIADLTAYNDGLNKGNVSEGDYDSYYNMTAAKKLAKKDGHDFDKLPKFARGKGVAHQQKYLDMAKAERANVNEGNQWKVTISKNGTKTQFLVFSDEDKAIKTAKYINDGGMGDEFKAVVNVNEDLSENALANDIEIMGEKFNFSDICPSAHKLVQNQALVYQGHSRVLPTVLSFAIKHRNFFNLEKKALGPQGITVDEYNDDVTRLYTEILNIAEKLGVRKQAKEYMDMHMAKIKDAGFKASEPGGSSDMSFEERYEPTDKELDFADDIEYEEDWRDERDAMFGKPMGKLEEKLAEVRNRLGDAIEGYTDLHKNDVVLESFLGEEELNEDNTQSTFDDYFAPVVGNNKTMSDMNTQQALEDKAIDVDKLSPDYLADFYNFPEYEETLDSEVINRREFKLAMGRLRQVSYKDITGEETLENVLPYPNYYTFVRFGDDIYLAHEYGKYHTKLSFGVRLRRESLDEAAKPDEKEVKKRAAELMKDPKFKSRYRGKQGVEFIKHAKAAAKKELQGQKKINEGSVQTFTNNLDRYQSYPHVYVFKVGTMSTDKQGGKFVYNNTYEVKDGLDWNGVLAQVDQLIASPETISVGVDIYYTTGQKEGQLGGQAEVVRWSHDAVYKAPKSDYILNARKNQFEDEEAERIIAIRKFMNSSLMGRPPQNVDNQAEKLYPAIKRMKDEVKNILANK